MTLTLAAAVTREGGGCGATTGSDGSREASGDEYEESNPGGWKGWRCGGGGGGSGDAQTDAGGATCGVTVAFIVPGWVLWSSLGTATSVAAADGGETARLRDRVLAATLVAAGVATSACGVAAVAAEIV